MSISEDMVDGTMCQTCGVWNDDLIKAGEGWHIGDPPVNWKAPGFPWTCTSCSKGEGKEKIETVYHEEDTVSLVSTYVQAQSGSWFQNPIVRDASNTWFICWDDDDPIELVCRTSIEAKQVLTWLESKGWKLSIVRNQYDKGHTRLFGPFTEPNFHHARSYFLRQQNGPHAWMLSEYDQLYNKQPHCQGVFYSDDKG